MKYLRQTITNIYIFSFFLLLGCSTVRLSDCPKCPRLQLLTCPDLKPIKTSISYPKNQSFFSSRKREGLLCLDKENVKILIKNIDALKQCKAGYETLLQEYNKLVK